MVRAALSSTGPGGEGRDASAASPAHSFSLSLQSAASEMHHPPLSSSSSAALMSSPSAVNFSSTMVGPAVEEARRCRYKTGKCSNARSSKRNGQPHQLCLYHRDKANQIQRKFDRQKRQVLRERKGSSLSPSNSARHSPTSSSTSASGPHASFSGLHRSHLQLHYSQQQQRHSHLHQFQHKSPLNTTSASSVRNVTNFVPRFTSLAAKDLDIYSDSDASSRFSTDSSSSDVSSSSMWADLPSPVSATAFMGLLRLTPVAAPTTSTPTDPQGMITPTSTSATAQGHLSHDEIDFLCSAMLE